MRVNSGQERKCTGSTANQFPTPPVSFTRCVTDDVQTPESALSAWDYYPAGHAHQFLLKGAIDPLGNRTDYVYDAAVRLAQVCR